MRQPVARSVEISLLGAEVSTQTLGLHTTLAILIVALATPTLMLWLSPLRSLREVPVHESHLRTT
jgi:hypothetical protein